MALKRFSLLFAVLSLLLLLLPEKALGAVDFPNTSANGILGFAGNAKMKKESLKPAQPAEKTARSFISKV